VEAKTTYGIALVTPLLADTSPQTPARGGYQADVFAVDFDKGQVTCPQGQTSTSWNPCTQRGTETIVAAFPVSVCRPCPVRAVHDRLSAAVAGAGVALRASCRSRSRGSALIVGLSGWHNPAAPSTPVTAQQIGTHLHHRCTLGHHMATTPNPTDPS
jgi:hypothetical protein